MEINKDIVCIVVTHNPPPTIYKLTEQISNIRILMIDSSDSDKYNSMKEHFKNKENVTVYHENRHIGLSNALNTGINMCQEMGFKYLLIMEDDSYFQDNVNLINIVNNFSYSHNNDPVLYLSETDTNSADDFFPVNYYLGTNTGVVISFNLAHEISFRSDFFMDQVDIDFQYNVRSHGHKIYLTKNGIIARLPIGREERRGINTISIFRFYLLTRNTLRLFIENKISPVAFVYIPGYFFKGVVAGQNVKLLLKALFHGLYDGITNNLGITKTLKFFRPDLQS